MASISYDFTRPQTDFLYDKAIVQFENATVSLRLIPDYNTNIVEHILPTSPSGVGLDLIADRDPSTFYVDDTLVPQSQITWDLTEVMNIARVDFTLTQDKRLWGLVIIEATADADFAIQANTKVIYASGDANVLATYPGNPQPTDPNIPISLITKSLSQTVQARLIRITLQAYANSVDQNRYLTNFVVYASNYSTSNPRIVSTKVVDTIDLTMLTDTDLMPSGTAIGYSFLVNYDTEWYYNGFEWQVGNKTFDQSTSLTNLSGKLSQLLPSRDRSKVQTVFYLSTTDPSVTPVIQVLTLQYDASAPVVNVPTVRMIGILRDAFSKPIVGASVKATFMPKGSNKYTLNGVRITFPNPVTATTNENGFFVINVAPTDNMLPSSGLPADYAQWNITINATNPTYSESLTGVVNSVEEIDIFATGFGL